MTSLEKRLSEAEVRAFGVYGLAGRIYNFLNEYMGESLPSSPEAREESAALFWDLAERTAELGDLVRGAIIAFKLVAQELEEGN